MILINLDTLEVANKLVKICENYSNHMEVDILHERYVLNGVSILAVASLLGNTVIVEPKTEDTLLLGYFIKDIQGIGAWVENKD